MITFCQPSQSKTEEPAAANPAPVSPATSAWLSLVGMPQRQAAVLQTIMLIMAAATTGKPIASGLTIPFPIVAATAVPVEIAPTILSTAAISTALPGDKTRVDTTVAIALGASVHPLTNSAPNINISVKTRRKVTSGILQGYPLQDIRHILAPVGSALQGLVNFTPFNQFGNIRSVFKKLPDSRPVYPVGRVLQPVDFHARFQHFLEFFFMPQAGDRFFHLHRPH